MAPSVQLVYRQTAGVTLELIDQVAGGEEQIDGYSGCQNGPFEPWPAEV